MLYLDRANHQLFTLLPKASVPDFLSCSWLFDAVYETGILCTCAACSYAQALGAFAC